MYITVIQILFLCVAFILGYFTEHFKNVWQTLQPNPFSLPKLVAVMKGTFTRKTAFPLTIMALMILAIIILNFFNMNKLEEAEKQRTADLIEAVTQTIEENLEQRNIALIEAINNQTDAILKAIQQIGGQNAK